MLGEAAHIYGCYPKRPRFKADISEPELNSQENGIWLCRKCHKIIDSDGEQYSASVLFLWKEMAERKAGLRNLSILEERKHSLQDEIRSAIQLKQQYLEALDPRFEVKLNAKSDRIQGEILAKESVSFRAYGQSDNNLSKNIREGRNFQLSGSVIGSKLFDHLMGDRSVIDFSIDSKQIRLDFIVDSESLMLGDFFVYLGSEFIRVASEETFSEIFIEFLLPLSGNVKPVFNITFHETLKAGQYVSRYIGHNIAQQLIRAIQTSGVELFVVEGLNRISMGKVTSNEISNLDSIQQFIFDLCAIDQSDSELKLRIPASFSPEEHFEIFSIARLLEGKAVAREIVGGLSLAFDGNPQIFESYLSNREPGHILLHFVAGEVNASICNNSIPFPAHTLHFKNFFVKSIDVIDRGSSAHRISLVPGESGPIEQLLVPGTSAKVPDRKDLVVAASGRPVYATSR